MGCTSPNAIVPILPPVNPNAPPLNVPNREPLSLKIEPLTDIEKICSTMRTLNTNKIIFATEKILSWSIG
jgi:hypothetical protein